jgi:hypothetical protein
MAPAVVVNPSSAHGRAGREWPSIESALAAALGPLAVRFTNGPLVATTLCGDALRAGADLVVAVGGDGTINEVVNGFFASASSNRARRWRSSRSARAAISVARSGCRSTWAARSGPSRRGASGRSTSVG